MIRASFGAVLATAYSFFIASLFSYCSLNAQSDIYYQTRTDVIVVPVYVYTKDGVPVRDLSIIDFEIWEGRRKCDLKDLELIDHTAISDEEVAILPPAGRRQFLFLFDLSFTNPGGLMAARNAAKNFEEAHTVPNDLIAVATFSGPGGINLVCPFTTDRNRIEKALSDLGLAQSFIYRDQAGFTYEDYLNFKSRKLDMDIAELLLSTEKWRYSTALGRYIDVLGVIGDALEIMHGRKNIVFFSDGFDEEAVLGQTERKGTETLWDVLSTGTETAGTSGSGFMHDKFVKALKSNAKSNAVFYVVDTNRLQTVSTAGADVRELRNKMGDAGTPMYEKSSSQKGYYSLYKTADETGGVLYRNLNDLDSVLADISKRTSYGYLLTFAPSRPGKPGEFREIKVKVKRPGLRVDCQRGYTFEKLYSELTPEEKQFQLAEYISKDIVSTRIPFEFDARVFPGDGRLARIPFSVEINGDVFTSLKKQRHEPVAIEIYGYLLGVRNAPLDFCFNVIESKTSGASEELERRGLKYYGLLNAPPGRWKIKCIVRDRELGMISSNISIIDVPDYAAGGLHLCGPVFIEREQGWVSILDNMKLEPKDRLKGRPLEYPYRWGERDLVPAINPPVASPDGEIVFLRIYGVGDSEDDLSNLRVTFHVVDNTGESRALKGITLLDRQSSKGALDLLFQVPLAGLGLQPGKYSLKVETEDDSSGLRDQAEAAFTIPTR